LLFKAAACQYDNNTYYVTGVHNLKPGSNANVVLMRIDSNGDRLWEKYYDQGNFNYAQGIVALKNGNLIIGAERNDLNQTVEHANTWLIELDTGGTVIRQWFDSNDSTYAAKGLLQTKDSGFIYGAAKKFNEDGGLVSTIATIVKMDNNFNKQWTFLGGEASLFTEITDIEMLPGGNYIACGNKPFYAVDSNTLGGWILKLDTAGHVIWERTYRGIAATETLNFLNDVDVLPDGSLIAVGMAQDYNQQPFQRGWFLKLDSNGCEIENCLVGINPQPSKGGLNSQIQVYPNPFESELAITLNKEDIEQATFTITNLMEQSIYRKQETNLTSGYTKMLNLSWLPDGMYVLEVMVDGERVVRQIVKE